MKPATCIAVIAVLLLLPLLLIPQAPPPTMEYLAANQKVILEQLQMVLDVRKLALQDSQRISDQDLRLEALEKRITEHMKSGISDPSDIAVLKLKVDTIISGISYLGMGISTILLGLVGFVIQRRLTRQTPPEWAVSAAAGVATRLAAHDELLEQYHVDVKGQLKDVKEQAIAATEAANTVNSKILNIGVEMRDHKPLKETGKP